jgi:hypothetical protein
MANISKFRAHESLNMDSASDWQIQSAVTADANGVAVNVSSYHTIHLQTDKDIYFTFNTTGEDDTMVPANDLGLKGGDTIYSLKIPRGLGNSIYLIMEGANATVKIILS